MGVFDSFVNKTKEEMKEISKVKDLHERFKLYKEAQLKCFERSLALYYIGEEVPTQEYGFPNSCTFAEWGGTSKLFKHTNLVRQDEYMGTFVVIKDQKLLTVTTDESQIIYPVYSKYGDLLATEKK